MGVKIVQSLTWGAPPLVSCEYMGAIRHPEIGALEHVGMRLAQRSTAVAVWRLVRRPMKLRRMSALASTARGLSPGVRSVLKLRALQSLAIALDCAIQAGRAG